MHPEQAECSNLAELLAQVGQQLDDYLQFEHPDALAGSTQWQADLTSEMPQKGLGHQAVLQQFGETVLPNGCAIARPGFSAYITTGASSIGVAAQAAAALAGTQRIGINAFSLLEQLSLSWLTKLFGLNPKMQGVYSSGGSVANLVALGAARQAAFEKRGIDVAEQGCCLPARIYTSALSHRTIHRAAAVLGLGRQAVVTVASDDLGRLSAPALAGQVQQDIAAGYLPVAVVCNAGATSTGVVDPIAEIIQQAREFGLWVHVDGAYGLPGILDPQVSALFDGVALADSVIVDPHKWLGAPVGIGATFVKDAALLKRAFAQGASDYLEGSALAGSPQEQHVQHSMDSLGVPYCDYGVELSAPSRGAVVWALLSEIGVDGIRARICRHNAMARWLAEQVQAHPHLQLLQQPSLSICCFRYYLPGYPDLNQLNRQIHRQLVRNNNNLPSTAMINGQLAIRPCFVGARSGWAEAKSLLQEVLDIGQALGRDFANTSQQGSQTEQNIRTQANETL